MTASQPHVTRGAAIAGTPYVLRALLVWLTVYRRIWRSSAFSSILGPLFYLGALGFGLGSLVDRHQGGLGGVPYLAYVAPAILAVQAMQSALQEATFPVYGGIKWNPRYLAARATPLRPADIYRGHLLFITLRLAMNSAVFLAIAAAFGSVRSPWAVAALPAAVLTGLAFAAPVAAWAVTVERDTAFNYMFRFGMTPLMLFSGTFFPLSQLPAWIRPVAYATPLWHGVALCRALTLGTIDPGSLAVHLAYLVALACAGLAAGTRTYTRRLYV
ncbi:MAG TPA: ABC transporter permease [Trebonia sp.]|nr:ABC transporter permease [Trebonia sp.]